VTAADPSPQAAGARTSLPARAPDRTCDERGARCPAPVIALARAAAALGPGALVEVLSDDEAAATDIPAWARLRGATYLGSAPPQDGRGGTAYYLLTAGPPAG
jgi:TusA-related sulfurtransferase